MKESPIQNKFKLTKTTIALILCLFLVSFAAEFIFIGLFSSLLWVLVFIQGALIAGFVTYFLPTKENIKRTFLAQMLLLLTLIGMIVLSNFSLPAIGTVLGFIVTAPFLLLPLVFSALVFLLISQNQTPNNYKKWLTNISTALTVLSILLLFFPNPLSLPVQLMGLSQLASVAMQIVMLLAVLLIAKAVSSLLVVICQRQNEEKFTNNTLRFIAIFTNYIFPNLLQNYQNAKTPAAKQRASFLLIVNISGAIATAVIISTIALSSFTLIPLLTVIIPTIFIAMLIAGTNLFVALKFKEINIEKREKIFSTKLIEILQSLNLKTQIADYITPQEKMMYEFIENFELNNNKNIIKKISETISTTLEKLDVDTDGKQYNFSKQLLIETKLWSLINSFLELNKYKFVENNLENNQSIDTNNSYVITYNIVKMSTNTYTIQFLTIKTLGDKENLLIHGFDSKDSACKYINLGLVWTNIFKTNFLEDNYHDTDYLEADDFNTDYNHEIVSSKLNINNTDNFSMGSSSQLQQDIPKNNLNSTPEAIFLEQLNKTKISTTTTDIEKEFIENFYKKYNAYKADNKDDKADSENDLRRIIIETVQTLNNKSLLINTSLWPCISTYLPQVNDSSDGNNERKYCIKESVVIKDSSNFEDNNPDNITANSVILTNPPINIDNNLPIHLHNLSKIKLGENDNNVNSSNKLNINQRNIALEKKDEKLADERNNETPEQKFHNQLQKIKKNEPTTVEITFVDTFENNYKNSNSVDNLRKLIILTWGNLKPWSRMLLMSSRVFPAVYEYMNLKDYQFFNLIFKVIPDKNKNKHYFIYYSIYKNNDPDALLYVLKFDSVDSVNTYYFSSKQEAENYIKENKHWDNLLKIDYFADINNIPDSKFRPSDNAYPQSTSTNVAIQNPLNRSLSITKTDEIGSIKDPNDQKQLEPKNIFSQKLKDIVDIYNITTPTEVTFNTTFTDIYNNCQTDTLEMLIIKTLKKYFEAQGYESDEDKKNRLKMQEAELMNSKVWPLISAYMNLSEYQFFNQSQANQHNKHKNEHFNIYYKIIKCDPFYVIKFNNIIVEDNMLIITDFDSIQDIDNYMNSQAYWPKLLQSEHFDYINNLPKLSNSSQSEEIEEIKVEEIKQVGNDDKLENEVKENILEDEFYNKLKNIQNNNPSDIEKEFIKHFKTNYELPNQEQNLRQLIIDTFTNLHSNVELNPRWEWLLISSRIWKLVDRSMDLIQYQFFDLSPSISKKMQDKHINKHYNIYYTIEYNSKDNYNYSINFNSIINTDKPSQRSIINGFDSKDRAEYYINQKRYWPKLLTNSYFIDINNIPNDMFQNIYNKNYNKNIAETSKEDNIKVFVERPKNLAVENTIKLLDENKIKSSNNISFWPLGIGKQKEKIHVYEEEDNKYELKNCDYKVEINYTYTIDEISPMINYTLSINLINLKNEHEQSKIIGSIKYQSSYSELKPIAIQRDIVRYTNSPEKNQEFKNELTKLLNPHINGFKGVTAKSIDYIFHRTFIKERSNKAHSGPTL